MTRCEAALLALLALAGAVHATEPTVVTVEVTGVGTIVNGDLAKAGDEALVDAQRLAVEQGCGILVSSETSVLDFQLLYDRIHTQAAGYLASYDILERGRREDGLYAVKIRAQVRLDPILGDVLEVPALVERLNRPRLLVVLQEVDQGQPSPQHLATLEAQRALLAKGLDVVDATQIARLYQPEVLQSALEGDPGKLLQVATEEGVEVAIVGRVEVHPLESVVGGMFSAGATIEAKAFNTQTARLLAANSLSLGADPKQPGVAAVDAKGAVAGAFRKAASELFLGGGPDAVRNAFTAAILTKWATSPTIVQLTVSHVTFGQRRALLDALRGRRFVQEVTQRKYAAEVLTVELRTPGSVSSVLDSIDGLNVGGKTLAVTGFQGDAARAELR